MPTKLFFRSRATIWRPWEINPPQVAYWEIQVVDRNWLACRIKTKKRTTTRRRLAATRIAGLDRRTASNSSKLVESDIKGTIGGWRFNVRSKAQAKQQLRLNSFWQTEGTKCVIDQGRASRIGSSLQGRFALSQQAPGL